MALDFQYDELLLKDGLITNLSVGGFNYGYSFAVRYPSYRGTFLSCIEALEVTIDGLKVPLADLRFTVNGKEFLASELSELSHEYWFVLDDAFITVLKDGGIVQGEHQVSVYLKHRVPYTGYFGQYLVLDSVCEKKLKAV